MAGNKTLKLKLKPLPNESLIKNLNEQFELRLKGVKLVKDLNSLQQQNKKIQGKPEISLLPKYNKEAPTKIAPGVIKYNHKGNNVNLLLFVPKYEHVQENKLSTDATEQRTYSHTHDNSNNLTICENYHLFGYQFPLVVHPHQYGTINDPLCNDRLGWAGYFIRPNPHISSYCPLYVNPHVPHNVTFNEKDCAKGSAPRLVLA